MATKNDFPLYLHGSGQWTKTIRGRKWYFGTDKTAALEKYLDEKDAIKAGRNPRAKSYSDGNAHSIVPLGNLYSNYLALRVAEGKIVQRTKLEAEKTIKKLIEICGSNDRPADWTAFDFDRFRSQLFEPVKRTTELRGGIKGPSVERRSVATVDGDVRRIQAFLNWCHNRKLIPAPDYGDALAQMSAKEKKIVRRKRGKRTIDPKTIHAILDKCSVWSKPLVMLAINCGMGNKDVGLLTVNDYSGGEWLDYPRLKTACDRRIWLWPETRKAIDDYLKIRQFPFGKGNSSILFATKHRSVWYRETDQGTHDAISKVFHRACELANVDGDFGFYDCRRTFQTVAEETGDFVAVRHVMGHAPLTNDMGAVYRQEVSDERIKRVCSHVRKWLFGK